MKRIDLLLAGASLVLLLTLVAACGGGGGGIGGTGQAGTLRVSLTDAPSCGYDEVNVTIERVRVHQSASAADDDGGWEDIVLPAPKRVDLLTLTNGVVEELGETQLASGRYTQLRLVLAPNTASNPFTNSVVPTGGRETALDTPSATQSGLKINVNLDVPPQQVLDVVLDFDACKSVVRRGKAGRYNLKPVLTATPRLSDAGLRVIGWVDPALVAPTTLVSIQSSGHVLKSTLPAADGRFVLYPVPTGAYDLVITADGRATGVMPAVPVTDTAYTVVNSAAVPLAPPLAASAPRAVNGTLAPATGTVRALLPMTGGLTIEQAFAPVDGDSGAFTFSLPTVPAVTTPYAPNPTAFTWTPQPTAGLYTLEAQSGGALKTQAIDATAPVPPVTFVFP